MYKAQEVLESEHDDSRPLFAETLSGNTTSCLSLLVKRIKQSVNASIANHSIPEAQRGRH